MDFHGHLGNARGYGVHEELRRHVAEPTEGYRPLGCVLGSRHHDVVGEFRSSGEDGRGLPV
jgi:hypothetical protein